MSVLPDAPEAWRTLLRRFEQGACENEAFATAVARHFNVSVRTARRYVLATFGCGPKTLERILRFRRFRAVIRQHHALSLTSAAYICGYYDQSHLTREARALSAMTPSEILQQERGIS